MKAKGEKLKKEEKNEKKVLTTVPAFANISERLAAGDKTAPETPGSIGVRQRKSLKKVEKT